MGGWGGGGMVLVWVFFLALAVGGLLLIVRGFGDGRGREPSEASPRALAVLEERYARGEIDRDQFEDRRSTLRGGRPE